MMRLAKDICVGDEYGILKEHDSKVGVDTAQEEQSGSRYA